MAKDPLPPLRPWYWIAAMRFWSWITWPSTARKLKQAGFRHTGFMTWETGPDNPGQSRDLGGQSWPT